MIGRLALGPRAAVWGFGRVRRGSRAPRTSSAPNGAGPQPGGASTQGFGWGAPAGRRPGDIEGTAEEIRDEDSLPPGERGAFPG